MAPPDRSSIREAIVGATRVLVAAGFAPEDALIDARVLARHAFGLDGEALIVRELEPPDATGLATYDRLVARRLAHEPVAYIVGHREFFGREFLVTPAVLVPRPETELIVELALARLPDRCQPLAIVDIGTGSGCLAVTLACECPNASVTATDVSASALAVARRNAERHAVADRITFVEARGVGHVSRADLVVSNPPYVAWADRDHLPAEVRDHEPAEALFAGEDGLAVIREVIVEAGDVLTPGTGWLLLEIGAGQADAVRALVDADGRYETPQVAADLQGIPRTFAARRR